MTPPNRDLINNNKEPHITSYISILHLNIRCIRNKILEIEAQNLKYDFLCFSEHWLRMEEMDILNINGYNVVTGYCRSNTVHGGVVILAKTNLINLCVEANEINNLSIEVHCELCAIKCDKLNLILITVYRSPAGNFDIFLNTLHSMFNLIINKKCVVIINGDFNLYFNTKDKKTLIFNDLIQTFGFYSTIVNNTRGNSCLDNILINVADDTFSVKTIDTNLSDHLAITIRYYINSIQSCNKLIYHKPITTWGLFLLPT